MRGFKFSSFITLLTASLLASACTTTRPNLTTREPAIFPTPPEHVAHMLRLNYVDAEAAARIANDVADVATTAEPRTNTLVIKGTTEAVERAEEFVKKLDVAPADAADPTVVLVYTLKYAHADEICALLKQMQKEGFIEGLGETTVPFVVVAEKRSNTLVLMLDRKFQEKTQEILAHLDVPLAARQ